MERIDWTQYFSELVKLVAKRSPCERLQVGCVLVKDNRIVATGYNGFLPSAPHKSIVVDNHEQATVHAEQNCIADCAKRGAVVEGGSVYITHYPCINCYKILVASGIKNIYYIHDYKNNPIVEQINKDLAVNIIQINNNSNNKSKSKENNDDISNFIL
jgi:dCMP deaminase